MIRRLKDMIKSVVMKFRRLVPLLALLATVAMAQETIRQHFEAGQRYQASGESSLAESEYRQALGLVLEQLGAVLTDARKLDQALKAYQEAAEARANSTDAILGQARIYLLQKNVEAGIQTVEQVLITNPTQLTAKHLLAKLYLLSGRTKEALVELEDVVAKRPSDLSAAYSLAVVYLQEKRAEDVDRIFKGMINSLGESPELHVLIGRTYKEVGRAADDSHLDRAIEHFQRAIELNPTVPRAHLYLGQTLIVRKGVGEIPNVIGLFKKEVALTPNAFVANFLLGLSYCETRQYQPALEYLQRAVKADPGVPEAYHYLGAAYQGLQQFEKAIPNLKKAVELTTDVSRGDYSVANTHYILGQIYRRQGKVEEATRELQISADLKSKSITSAKDSLRAFLKSDSESQASLQHREGGDRTVASSLDIELPTLVPPNTARPLESDLTASVATIYSALGILRGSQNDPSQAVQLFQRALQWKADIKDGQYNLGLSFFNLKAYDRAQPLLEKESLSRPNNITVQHLLSLCYFYQADFQKAIPLLRKTIQSKPEDPELQVALSISLLRTRQSPEAEKILRSLVAKNAGNASLRMLLGQALAQQGSYLEAAAEFDEVVKSDPKLPEANFDAGMAYLRASRFEPAEAAFRRELAIRPGDAKSHYHLGYLLLMRHEVDEGLDEIRKAVEIEPRYGEAHYQLGKSYLQQGKVDEAKQSLETAVRYEPNKDYIHYQLAQAYMRLGRETDAQREMEIYRKLKAQAREATLPQDASPREANPRPPVP
jgi:tetratricopeptide (TPR) repeat protein